MTRSLFVAIFVLAFSTCAVDVGSGGLTIQVQVISSTGADVADRPVRLYLTVDGWESEAGSLVSATTDANGLATMQLPEPGLVFIDARVSPTESNWAGEIGYIANGAAALEVLTERNPTSAMTGRAWVVTDAAPDTESGGDPSQDLLDCWMGTVFTFDKAADRTGPAEVVTPDDCRLIDLRDYDAWLDDPTSPYFDIQHSISGFPLRLELTYEDDSVTASVLIDLDDDGRGDPETRTLISLAPF